MTMGAAAKLRGFPHPPLPKQYVGQRQLGLLCGSSHVLQPWWRGRRLLWLPDRGGLFTLGGSPYRSGQRPKGYWLGRKPLEVVLMPGNKIGFMDVMTPEAWEDRVDFAYDSGLDIVYASIESTFGINECLHRWRAEYGNRIDGAILKKTKVPYPWLPLGRRELDGWLRIKRPV